MKSLLLLWKWVADDLATWCCTSATMDFKTVQGRVKHEGFSFLTITLPSLGKEFERALDVGLVDRRIFTSFRRKQGSELPRFLGGFLDQVFDRASGVLLDEPSVDAIQAIRQLTLMFGKVSIPCSDARVKTAIDGFILCEQEVKDADARISDSDRADFRRISSLLFSSVFSKVDREVYDGTLTPKHGPGSTADKLTGNRKFDQSTWPSRLEEYFPFGEYAIPNWSYYDRLGEIDFLEPGSEMPVRVITVPKTLKTPRIIAIEPTAMQYAQQAVLRSIRENLAQCSYLHQMIGFDDQVPNQDLARLGSSSGSLATLDLSEASDRVSNLLVRDMLSQWPHLHRAVDACRSRSADVPGHGVIRLSKFASMGSALTFPIEAMVFTTLVFMGIERGLNTSLSLRDVKRLRGQVRIYGDDIIVPVDTVREVVRILETFGLKVNHGKSFWTGKFRESCGKEFYDGHDVSIVRVRRLLPSQPRDALGIASYVAFRNQLYFAGLWDACKCIDLEIRKLIKFPVVLESSPVLGRASFLGYQTDRVSTETFAPQVRGHVLKPRIPSDPLDGPGALLKCLLKLGDSDPADTEPKARFYGTKLPTGVSNHLERSGRPSVVDIKPIYGSPF